MQIEDHYGQILGINSPWDISEVNLDIANSRVDIIIEYTDHQGDCPKCGAICPKHDDRNQRTWRHLDTMQFSTFLHCEQPRIRCSEDGVQTVMAPWAEKHSRFTLLFEDFAICVLQAAGNVKDAAELLKLNWHQINAIKARAVERGLKRRVDEPVPYLGIDEKQFRSGHRYITSLVDLQQGRVLDVEEERTEKACKTLINKALTSKQRSEVQAIAMDMWKAFSNAVTKYLPEAAIVHDRFHVSQYLNKAVDQVRKSEHKELLGNGDNRLSKSKYFWLTNPENVTDKISDKFEHLKKTELKVARAWSIKELFRSFWEQCSKEEALLHFNSWYSWAIRCRLKPVKKVAVMLKKHLANLLTYFDHRISNGVAEGLNSKIQGVKANARGFRSFVGFRNSILFYCGKLDMAI